MIQNITLAVDAHVFHLQCGEHRGTMGIGIHFIHLTETVGKDDGLRRRHQ